MKLSIYHRFAFFGLHGFFDEIIFTALHDFIIHDPNFKLSGHSSIWAFFIYGSGSLLVEWMYYKYLKGKRNIVIRGLSYIVIAFTWEFTTGMILHQFSACPWDYTHKDFDFMGLVTLDYAPFWCGAGFYQEYLSTFLDSLEIKEANNNKQIQTCSVCHGKTNYCNGGQNINVEEKQKIA